jgi:hypothetical protein
MAIQFSNLASTSLASGVSSTATSISVTSAASFPSLGSGDYFYATLGAGTGSEIVKVTAISGTTFTVSRGQDGTTAVSHSAGGDVALRVTAGALEDLRDGGQVYTAGSGLGLSGNEFTNTAPDQTVSISGSGSTTVTGTYPSFTVSSTSYSHPSAHPISFITGLQTALDGKVDDSQVLTDVPANALFTDTVYTLPFTDNSSNWNTAYGWGDHSTAGYLTSHQSLSGYATETYVGTQITNLVDSAPATMDTLNELAAALGDDPNFATTVSTSIGTKLPLSGGTLTGALSGTTAQFANVGIGASPNAHGLYVYHTYNYEAVKFQTNQGGSLARFTDTTASIEIGVQSGKPVIRTGNTARLTVDGANVDINSGALKMAGTTVIDSSRNLTNIGTYTGQGLATITNSSNQHLRLAYSSGFYWNIYRESTTGDLVFDSSNTAGEFVRFDAVDKTISTIAGYKVNGTTVIDSSRNLTNIGTIGSGAITSTSSMNAAGGYYVSGTEVVTASRNLTNIGTADFSGKVNFQGDAAIEGGSGYGVFKGYTSNDNHFISVRGSVATGSSTPNLTGGHQTTFVEHAENNDTTGWYFKSRQTGTYQEIARITRTGGMHLQGNKVWHAGNDGSGSGLDADLLDGQHGSYYRNASNLNAGRVPDAQMGTMLNTGSGSAGTLRLLSSNELQMYNASGSYEHLYINYKGSGTNISGTNVVVPRSGSITRAGNTVWDAGNDGSGSGLDADLLDGQQGSYYTGAKGGGQNYVASSASTSNRGNYGAGVWAYSGYNTGSNRPFTYDTTLQVMYTGSAGFELSTDWHSSKGQLKLRSLRDCCEGWSGYTTVWTSASDGSGSGLDADTVDGQHETAFVRVSTGLSSDLNSSALYRAGMFGWNSGTSNRPSDNYGQAISIVSEGSSHNNSSNWITQLGFGTGQNSAYFRSKTNAGGWGGWRTFWHTGNDGSGSGLDADLLDGQQGSSYLRSNVSANNSVDMRAPIFYDTDNTSYYLDPHSESVLNSLDVSAGIGNRTTVDMTSLSESTWYPVTIPLAPTRRSRIIIEVGLNSGSTPSWDTHPSGFSLHLDWTTIGSGWGTTGVIRKVNVWTEGWASGQIAGAIGQLGHSSYEYVYLRGGAKYHFRISHGGVPTVRSSSFTTNGQTVAPITSNIGEPWDGNTFHGKTKVSYLEATNDIKTQIFYDSNNTGYYVNPASTSKMWYLEMPHRANGDENIKVNNGQGENWRAINICMGGSDNAGIGYGNNTRSVFNRHNLAIHCSQYDSIRLHSDGWTTLFEVAGGSGDAWLKGQLEAPMLSLAGPSNTGYAYPNVKSYGSSNSGGVANYHMKFMALNGNANGSISTNYYQTTYATTSDYRAKEDFQPIINATSRLMSLNPVNFQWKDSDMRTDGFLAHEVAEVVSDAVVGEKDAVDEQGNDELQALDQSKLVPLLVKTIQEQQGVIEALEARISALEA